MIKFRYSEEFQKFCSKKHLFGGSLRFFVRQEAVQILICRISREVVAILLLFCFCSNVAPEFAGRRQEGRKKARRHAGGANRLLVIDREIESLVFFFRDILKPPRDWECFGVFDWFTFRSASKTYGLVVCVVYSIYFAFKFFGENLTDPHTK